MFNNVLNRLGYDVLSNVSIWLPLDMLKMYQIGYDMT